MTSKKTDTFSMRMNSKPKQKYDTQPKNKRNEILTYLRNAFELLCTEEYIDLSSEMMLLQKELDIHKKYLVNIESNIEYWESMRKECESQIEEVSSKIEEKNKVYSQYKRDMWNITEQFVLLCYSNEKDLLIFQNIIDGYNVYTVNEIVNEVKKNVNKNIGSVLTIESESIHLSNKLVSAIESICDDLKISD